MFKNMFRTVKNFLSKKTDSYPSSVNEVIDDDFKFRKSVIATMTEFSKLKPWKGSIDDQIAKIQWLSNQLSVIYEIDPPHVIFVDYFSLGSCYITKKKTILMAKGQDSKKFSIVTFLHEFAHHLGMNEKMACKWSINLFKKVFPDKFARLKQSGHMLLKDKK